MNCYNHEERTAANTCSHCGNWICGECTVNVGGRLLCKNCVGELAAEKINGGQTARSGHYVSGPAPGPGMPLGYEIPGPPRHKRRDVNGFFLFCLSAIPGLNYMYMGLMKKGLFIMTSFFLSIYLMSLSFSFMPFVTFMIMCASFFDGFAIRRRILAGEIVRDDIDNILEFAQKNKTLLIVLGCGFLGLSLLNKLQRSAMSVAGRFFGYGFSWELFNFLTSLASLAVIGLGIYIIFKAITRQSTSSAMDDHRTWDHNRDQENS